MLVVGMATATAFLGGSLVSQASEYLLNPPDLSPKVLCVPQATSCMLHAFRTHSQSAQH